MTMEKKRKSEEEEMDPDGDLGIKIIFADEVAIDNCMALPSLTTVGPGIGVPRLTRGTTAAQSKRNFIEWTDELVSMVCTEHCKIYTVSGERDWSTFSNLSEVEFGKILGKISKVQRWTNDIVSNNFSCGAFIMITGAGRGSVSHVGMFIGPFQT